MSPEKSSGKRGGLDTPAKTQAGEAMTTAEEATSVLKNRARILAARELETAIENFYAEIIVVERSGIRLGIPIHTSREVRSVEVSSVPGATAVVCGVFQIRGRTCGLVDLGPFFGETGPPGHGNSVLVAVLETSAGEIGLLIDEVLGPRKVLVEDVDDGLGESLLGFVAAVTHDVVHVLDLDRLVAIPEIRL